MDYKTTLALLFLSSMMLFGCLGPAPEDIKNAVREGVSEALSENPMVVTTEAPPDTGSRLSSVEAILGPLRDDSLLSMKVESMPTWMTRRGYMLMEENTTTLSASGTVMQYVYNNVSGTTQYLFKIFLSSGNTTANPFYVEYCPYANYSAPIQCLNSSRNGTGAWYNLTGAQVSASAPWYLDLTQTPYENEYGETLKIIYLGDAGTAEGLATTVYANLSWTE